jgi:hypothetical protein
MSYDGHLGFGLLGDYDALPDLERIAEDLKWAIASLARAAGVRTRSTRPARKPASRRAEQSPSPNANANGRKPSGERAGAS